MWIRQDDFLLDHLQFRSCHPRPEWQMFTPNQASFEIHPSVREVETEPGSLHVQATTLGRALLVRARKLRPRLTSGRALCQPRVAVLASTVTGACEPGRMHMRRSYRRPRPGIGSTPRRAARGHLSKKLYCKKILINREKRWLYIVSLRRSADGRFVR
jgi:hypothetical protein